MTSMFWRRYPDFCLKYSNAFNFCYCGRFQYCFESSGPHQVKFTHFKEEHGLVSVHRQATTNKFNLRDLTLMNKMLNLTLILIKLCPVPIKL